MFRSTFKQNFEKVFPNVAELIRSLKRRDHAFLSCLMQNIESNFIINTVCRRLMNEMPEAPVFTIHDSILTTEPFVDDIQAIMKGEFSHLGLSPSFHIEDYSVKRTEPSDGP
jgi:hypothetical protein